MEFFLGIDGGGTHTRAFAVDARGLCAGWGESASSNPNHAPPEVVRKCLESAIAPAVATFGGVRSHCSGVFVGMAGVTDERGRQEIAEHVRQCGLASARVDVDHDIRIALAGGLAGQPGIALIVGTGSSCYGRGEDGRTWQTGGWGSLIADEGSGYFLGIRAIRAAARMCDGRQQKTALQRDVFAWLGISEIEHLLSRLYDPGMSRTEIASFAPRVIALAEQGDTAAINILDEGAAALAEMVAANHRCLPTSPNPKLVITGGLGTASTIYRRRIEAAMALQLPEVCLCALLLAPVVGAALLAMQQNGLNITADLIERLKRLSP